MLRRQRSVHKRDGTWGLAQRASAMRPTLCGTSFACLSTRHIHDGVFVNTPHSRRHTDFVMGHKGFAKFTIGCHILGRVAAVINRNNLFRARSDMLVVTCSGVIVVISGPSRVSMFRLVRSWLFCSSGFWLRLFLSHVSGWLKLVEVFAAVPLGVSCSLSCRVILCGPSGRRQVVSSRHSETTGRRVMRARLVFWKSGASGMGANAV